MVELQPIIVFHGLHFVRHLGICNRICVKLLQLMCAVITHNSVKKRSISVNKWLSYSQLSCFTAAILSAILEFIIRFVSNSYGYYVRCYSAQSKKKRRLYLNSLPEVHKRGTHTYDDSIRRNAMRCISPKNYWHISTYFVRGISKCIFCAYCAQIYFKIR